MTKRIDPGAPLEPAAELWKNRFHRQNQLVGAITSLLTKYGSTVNLDELHRAFLLTLMGHFTVGDAALYTASIDEAALHPALAYGRTPAGDLPEIAMDAPLALALGALRGATAADSLGRVPALDGTVRAMVSSYQVVAALHLKNKLVGAVLLGPRVSGQLWEDFDLNVLDSLAAVSATTFNNAVLVRNARLSAEEMRKLFDVRADVISRVSHEFLTPLTVIRAGIEMLDANSAGPRDWMLKSANRLEGLIQSLLALSRHDADATRSEASSDPVSIVADTVAAAGDAAAARDIRLTIKPAGTVPDVPAPTARTAIETALRALLDNAIAYSAPGSTVVVEIDLITGGPDTRRDGVLFPEWKTSTREMIAELAALTNSLDDPAPSPRPRASRPESRSRSARHVVIRVIDEGIGIPADEIATIAEPFRQASNCPVRGVKGKGLGLAIARRVVAGGGGFLSCRSALGSGTTFSIFLPVD
jgi:signal transduction histidine kinase